jgi:hypothetical protein
MAQSLENSLSGIAIFTVSQLHQSGIGIPASDTDSSKSNSAKLGTYKKHFGLKYDIVSLLAQNFLKWPYFYGTIPFVPC